MGDAPRRRAGKRQGAACERGADDAAARGAVNRRSVRAPHRRRSRAASRPSKRRRRVALREDPAVRQ
eukprot:10430323-Lingulodinium_polyedra.AAC.1